MTDSLKPEQSQLPTSPPVVGKFSGESRGQIFPRTKGVCIRRAKHTRGSVRTFQANSPSSDSPLPSCSAAFVSGTLRLFSCARPPRRSHS